MPLAFASVVFVFMLWVCACMWDRCQGAVLLPSSCRNKKVQLVPGDRRPALRYVPLAECHKNILTPARNHSTEPVDCNKCAYVPPTSSPPVVCLRLWCHSWSWHPSFGRSPRALRWILSSSWVVPAPFIIGFSVGSLLPPQPDRIDLWVRPASLYVTEPYKQCTALTALFSASFPSDTKLCGAVTSTNLD